LSSPPRLPNGRPDMQGVWQSAVISAAFDVQAHEADDQIPAGPSVIVDPPNGKLPYLPEAAKRAKLNWDERDRDPVGYCHPHGVPRQLVPPFPLEFVQDGDYFAILSETEHSVRVIPLDGRPHRKNYCPACRRRADGRVHDGPPEAVQLPSRSRNVGRTPSAARLDKLSDPFVDNWESGKESALRTSRACGPKTVGRRPMESLKALRLTLDSMSGGGALEQGAALGEEHYFAQAFAQLIELNFERAGRFGDGAGIHVRRIRESWRQKHGLRLWHLRCW
jgi:hypothetical protein